MNKCAIHGSYENFTGSGCPVCEYDSVITLPISWFEGLKECVKRVGVSQDDNKKYAVEYLLGYIQSVDLTTKIMRPQNRSNNGRL